MRADRSPHSAPFDNQHLFCIRSYSEAVINTLPDDPDYLIGTVDDPGFLLLGKRELFIGKIVAYFFEACQPSVLYAGLLCKLPGKI